MVSSGRALSDKEYKRQREHEGGRDTERKKERGTGRERKRAIESQREND